MLLINCPAVFEVEMMCFPPTAIALRSSAIVKVSGQKTTHHVVAVGCSGVPWVYSFKVSLDFRELEFGTDFSP